VDSTSKCTAEGFVDDLERCSVAKALARLIIERVDDEGKRIIGDLREVGPLRCDVAIGCFGSELSD
jgi:hypothetical protein